MAVGYLRVSLLNFVSASLLVNNSYGHILAGRKSNEPNYESLAKIPEAEFSADFWVRSAEDTISAKIQQTLNRNKARNTIFFLGDGMSMPTLMASRIYLGQMENRTGEESTLSFEDFPITGLARTYCVDTQVPDSACTATAYLAGVKTNKGMLGLTAATLRYDWAGQVDTKNRVTSIAQWALDAGLDVGFVTTTRVTDASPAGLYAHAADRDWESDADLPDNADRETVWDIARQLVDQEPGNRLKVIMGGGRREFLPKEQKGNRLDKTDLIQKWIENKSGTNFKYVTNKHELVSAMEDAPDYLMGLYQDSHFDYNLLSDEHQPTLEEMTDAAIKILSKSENGYYLFVEGGQIDKAHHDNWAKMALDETVEFSKAIALADRLTDPADTLLVVTADHAHVMSVSGYPSRGNDILGEVDDSEGDDGLPIITMSYANGPGYRPEVAGARVDVTKDEDFINREALFRYPASLPLDSETHGGDDVAVFARGPWQHLFTGSYEQSLLPHLVAYAMCLRGEHEAC